MATVAAAVPALKTPEPPPPTGLTTRPVANRLAAIVFLLALVGSLVVLLLPLFKGADGVLSQNPFVPARTSVVVEKHDADGNVVATTITEKDVSEDILDRTFAAGGLLLLRIGAAFLLAFAAAALLRRVLVGDFRFRAGPLDLSQDEAAAITLQTAKETVELEKDSSDWPKRPRLTPNGSDASRHAIWRSASPWSSSPSDSTGSTASSADASRPAKV